jgi:hypothetical protein
LSQRLLDEFKNATKSCEINDDEFGKLSAKEKKGLLDSSANELQLTKLKLNDLEKQLGQVSSSRTQKYFSVVPKRRRCRSGRYN